MNVKVKIATPRSIARGKRKNRVKRLANSKEDRRR